MEDDGYVIQSADALMDIDTRLQLEVNKLTSKKKPQATADAVSSSTTITTGSKRPRARSAGAMFHTPHFSVTCILF